MCPQTGNVVMSEGGQMMFEHFKVDVLPETHIILE